MFQLVWYYLFIYLIINITKSHPIIVYIIKCIYICTFYLYLGIAARPWNMAYNCSLTDREFYLKTQWSEKSGEIVIIQGHYCQLIRWLYTRLSWWNYWPTVIAVIRSNIYQKKGSAKHLWLVNTL